MRPVRQPWEVLEGPQTHITTFEKEKVREEKKKGRKKGGKANSSQVDVTDEASNPVPTPIQQTLTINPALVKQPAETMVIQMRARSQLLALK